MTTVTIDEDIEEAINDRIHRTKFENIDQYINFVLRELIGEDTNERKREDEDNDRLKSQLQNLGYI